MAGFSQRQLQVGEQIKRVLSRLFSEGDFPRELTQNTSVSQVKMASGLKHANILISSLSEEETKERAKNLNIHAKEIRFILAKHLETRFVPNLSFEADVTSFYAEKINDLLDSEDVKNDL